MSMIELIIAMGLTAIILVTVGGFLGAAEKASVLNGAVDRNTRTASNAMKEMERTLRVATANPEQASLTDDPAFIIAAAEDVKFYAYVNLASAEEQPVIVEFKVDPTTRNLVEYQYASTPITTGYWSYAAAPTRTTVLGGPVSVQTSGGQPLFTYAGSDGSAVPTDSTGAVSGTTNLRSIDSVAIKLEVGSTTAGARSNVLMSNTVGMVNLGQAN
ncbi:type II secretion system protein J [Curtobacterium sp. MCBD17_019]|uniref:PulJ/GspJ family protein n=1 Tax=Curtobacterium sp. MCBD17_019 TaxID=2175669 RepID=UPI000DA825C4|nr:hypothetical protein [Curtobacterium sp. MCBD17_019]PZE74095.1 hypothetical protein DEI82_12175 [Curtobacterium sp. MCBD17_019]